MSKSASQSFDELQGSTIDQLAEILRHLRQPLNPDGARVAVRAQFEAHLTAMKDRLKTIKDKFPGVPRPIKYGSDWIFKEITPLETNIHVILTYPPEKWPNWNDPSPTMTRLGDSGIWKLFESNVISFLHLHNHKHPTEAGYSERLESSDETPKWPGDPPELCQELELQATTVIRNRMKSERGYLMLCLGVYGQKWLQAHHEARTFERALGYTYTWHTVYIPVSQSPNRNLEIKVFRPNDPCKKATVACIAINSPAFTEYNIDDKNDCLGKALRLDAALEVLRSCLGVQASAATREHFFRYVYHQLEENDMLAGRHYTTNLLHR